jgi:hypothetical protein
VGLTYLVAITLAVLTLRTRFAAPEFFKRVPGGTLAKLAYASFLFASLAFELVLSEQIQGRPTALPRVSAQTFGDLVGSVAIVQTLVLAAFHLALARRPQRWNLPLVLACGAAMLVAGLSFQNSSGDVTAYVADGMVLNPYQPPAVRFPEPFGRLNDLWGTPILASPYGPLELLVSRLVDRTSATLEGRIHAFQILGALALVTTTVAVRARGAGIAVWALILCNPFLIQEYVAEAHNDLLGVALLALTTVVWTPLAVVLVAAASAIKISLGLVGLVVFARVRNRAARGAAALAAVALCAAIVALTGPQYLRAIRISAQAYAQPIAPLVTILHVAAVATICIAIAAALARGRFNPGATWASVSLAQYPLINYLVWSLPAALAGDATAAYLATLPYAGYEITNAIDEATFRGLVRALVYSAILFFTVLALRKKSSS